MLIVSNEEHPLPSRYCSFPAAGTEPNCVRYSSPCPPRNYPLNWQSLIQLSCIKYCFGNILPNKFRFISPFIFKRPLLSAFGKSIVFPARFPLAASHPILSASISNLLKSFGLCLENKTRLFNEAVGQVITFVSKPLFH